MITTRQIKSRFRKDHLKKLATELLSLDLELKSGTVKWFELRPNKTIDDLVDRVAFKGVQEGKNKVDDSYHRWHTMSIVVAHKRQYINGRMVDYESKYEIAYDDDWRVRDRGKFINAYHGDKFRNMTFEQQLDYIIMWRLLRSVDQVIKDNSAIDVF